MSPGEPFRSSVRVMEAVSTGTFGGTRTGATADVDTLVAALFEAEANRLVSLARFFTDDRTAAEDLVQEAFIRLSRSTGRIRDRTKAAAYLRSIVINLARDHNRRGLVSYRHRPPAVGDEPSAEERAGDRAARREVVDALRDVATAATRVSGVALLLGTDRRRNGRDSRNLGQLGEDTRQERPECAWPNRWSRSWILGTWRRNDERT